MRNNAGGWRLTVKSLSTKNGSKEKLWVHFTDASYSWSLSFGFEGA